MALSLMCIKANLISQLARRASKDFPLHVYKMQFPGPQGAERVCECGWARVVERDPAELCYSLSQLKLSSSLRAEASYNYMHSYSRLCVCAAHSQQPFEKVL